MDFMLKHIDTQIAEIDAKISTNSDDKNITRLQERRENLLKRKEELQQRLQNVVNEPHIGNINQIDMLKRQRENIQERLNNLNSRISQLEEQK